LGHFFANDDQIDCLQSVNENNNASKIEDTLTQAEINIQHHPIFIEQQNRLRGQYIKHTNSCIDDYIFRDAKSIEKKT
jgi:hypothetical protein